MKTTICLSFLLITLFSNSSFAESRVFTVDWEEKISYDEEVQMCDDSYFSHAEFWFAWPFVNEKEVEEQFASCDLEIEKSDYVNRDGDGYARYIVSGPWDCELEFKSRKEIQNQGFYTKFISLADGC